MISGALRPDDGEIRFQGVPIADLPANRIARLGIARTFQLVRVLEHLDCLENVVAGLAYPLRSAVGRAGARTRGRRSLDRVGPQERAGVSAPVN